MRFDENRSWFLKDNVMRFVGKQDPEKFYAAACDSQRERRLRSVHEFENAGRKLQVENERLEVFAALDVWIRARCGGSHYRRMSLRCEHCLKRIENVSHRARVDCSDALAETRAIESPQLIENNGRRAPSDPRRDPKLKWADRACKRRDDDPIQTRIEFVRRYNDTRARFLYLGSNGRIERNPVDFRPCYHVRSPRDLGSSAASSHSWSSCPSPAACRPASNRHPLTPFPRP